MHRTTLVSPVGLLLAVVLYIAINTLLSVWSPSMRMRVDVTEKGLYTLSQGAYATLADIDEPITFHYFYSQRLGQEVPFYASYARRIRELLVEIESASRGKVILREHNPEPFSDAEELAISHGIQGVPVNQDGGLAYFGLSGINSVDEIELIPFFQAERENLLEYDLVQTVHTLSNVEPFVIGVMSSLPVMGDMNAQMQGNPTIPWAISKHLRSNFNVINLPQSIDDLPNNIDVMMVVHPQKLSERTIFQLEQFLFRGGRALFFIDPKSESDFSKGPDLVSSSVHGIQLLFDRWGIRVPEGQLVGDRSLALRINAGSAAQPIPAEYLVWLNVSVDNMNQNDPVTNQLSALNLASAGYIDVKDESSLSMRPLVFSSPNSNLVSVEQVRGLRPNILGLLNSFQPDAQTYVMVGRLTGQVSSAFPGGPPPRIVPKTDKELQESPDSPQLMKSNGPINIILVADSDLLADRFWIRKQQFFGREVETQIARNADFVINALGNLAGSDKLRTLRSRGLYQRPFEKVKQIQKQAESRLQERKRELQDKLKETQQKIATFKGVRTTKNLNTGELKVEVSLTVKQQAALKLLRNDLLFNRKQLRSVQNSLREDVESLEKWLQFFNIGLIPLIVVIIGMIFGISRTTRRQRILFPIRKVVA